MAGVSRAVRLPQVDGQTFPQNIDPDPVTNNPNFFQLFRDDLFGSLGVAAIPIVDDQVVSQTAVNLNTAPEQTFNAVFSPTWNGAIWTTPGAAPRDNTNYIRLYKVVTRYYGNISPLANEYPKLTIKAAAKVFLADTAPTPNCLSNQDYAAIPAVDIDLDEHSTDQGFKVVTTDFDAQLFSGYTVWYFATVHPHNQVYEIHIDTDIHVYPTGGERAGFTLPAANTFTVQHRLNEQAPLQDFTALNNDGYKHFYDTTNPDKFDATIKGQVKSFTRFAIAADPVKVNNKKAALLPNLGLSGAGRVSHKTLTKQDNGDKFDPTIYTTRQGTWYTLGAAESRQVSYNSFIPSQLDSEQLLNLADIGFTPPLNGTEEDQILQSHTEGGMFIFRFESQSPTSNNGAIRIEKRNPDAQAMLLDQYRDINNPKDFTFNTDATNAEAVSLSYGKPYATGAPFTQNFDVHIASFGSIRESGQPPTNIYPGLSINWDFAKNPNIPYPYMGNGGRNILQVQVSQVLDENTSSEHFLAGYRCDISYGAIGGYTSYDAWFRDMRKFLADHRVDGFNPQLDDALYIAPCIPMTDSIAAMGWGDPMYVGADRTQAQSMIDLPPIGGGASVHSFDRAGGETTEIDEYAGLSQYTSWFPGAFDLNTLSQGLIGQMIAATDFVGAGGGTVGGLAGAAALAYYRHYLQQANGRNGPLLPRTVGQQVKQAPANRWMSPKDILNFYRVYLENLGSRDRGNGF